jgi:hypothetical protein
VATVLAHIPKQAMYLGTWVADLTAHKMPVVENVDKWHCKAARTGTDPKSSMCSSTDKRALQFQLINAKRVPLTHAHMRAITPTDACRSFQATGAQISWSSYKSKFPAHAGSSLGVVL